MRVVWATQRGVVIAVVAMLGLAAAVAMAFDAWGGGHNAHNPFADREVLVWSDSAAAASVGRTSNEGDRAIMERLAGVPTAVWVTPEAYPPGAARDFVAGVVEEARQADRVPLFVVYGITDRDCSGRESAGGLPADAYGPWIGEIAGALGEGAAVVLEPDALATAAECSQLDQRLSLMSDAVEQLKESATVYIDAGHSDWLPAADMVDLLVQAGVRDVRGFSTNVSAYQSDADELRYAAEIRRSLPDARFIVDSGRNGAGPDADGEWCNPRGRALGVEPAGVDDGSALDARLWIKPPGESDGRCGGGPAAGTFWVGNALSLARAAGW